MTKNEKPRAGDRIVVTNGAPWKPGEPEPPVGSLGVVGHVSPYHAGGQFECWLVIDGHDRPTILWTGQFNVVPNETNAQAVDHAVVARWTNHFARTS